MNHVGTWTVLCCERPTERSWKVSTLWFYIPVKAKMKPFQPSLLFWSSRKTWFEIVKENLSCLVFSHSCFHLVQLHMLILSSPIVLSLLHSDTYFSRSAFMQMGRGIKVTLSDHRTQSANYEPAGVGGLEEYVENGCSYVYLKTAYLLSHFPTTHLLHLTGSTFFLFSWDI